MGRKKGSILFALTPIRQVAWFTHRFKVNRLPRKVGTKFQGKRRIQLNNITWQEKYRAGHSWAVNESARGHLCVPQARSRGSM